MIQKPRNEHWSAIRGAAWKQRAFFSQSTLFKTAKCALKTAQTQKRANVLEPEMESTTAFEDWKSTFSA